MEDIAFPCAKCRKNMVVIEQRLSSRSLTMNLKNAEFRIQANRPVIVCGSCRREVAGLGFKML